MSSNVTIKMDARVLYGLIALVAVLGIFGIGWWLGNQIGPDEAAAPVAAPQAAAVNNPVTDPNAAAGTTIQVDPNNPANPAGAQPAPASANPVSVEESPLVAGQPRLWLPEVAETNFVYDFGEIPADAAVEKDFQITNLGDTELVIEDVSASCGCTAAAVGDSTVAPGETTTVRVSYDPRHNQEFGKFVTKQVRIKSNDPLVPLAEFTIQADVAAQ